VENYLKEGKKKTVSSRQQVFYSGDEGSGFSVFD
jgi:hypothetical protein